MTPEDWISLIGALLTGLALGWMVRGWLLSSRKTVPRRAVAAPQAKTRNGNAQQKRKEEAARARLQKEEADLAERRREIERRAAELAKADAELADRDRELEELRGRLEKRDKEHVALLSELGERRARITEAGADLYRHNQELIRHEEERETSLKALAERSHELEVLKQLKASYVAELDELTQEVQLLDGEVARTKAVLEGKQSELADAQALLSRQETELARIIESRGHAEREAALIEEQLAMVTLERDRLLEQLREATEDTDQRARLLRALREETQEVVELLPDHVGYGRPGDSFGDHHHQTPPFVLEAPKDDLTRIKGIGEGYASMLNAAGIRTFEQLSAMSAEELRDVLMAPRWRVTNVEAWIAEARALSTEQGSPRERPGIASGPTQDEFPDLPPPEEDDQFPDLPPWPGPYDDEEDDDAIG